MDECWRKDGKNGKHIKGAKLIDGQALVTELSCVAVLFFFRKKKGYKISASHATAVCRPANPCAQDGGTAQDAIQRGTQLMADLGNEEVHPLPLPSRGGGQLA